VVHTIINVFNKDHRRGPQNNYEVERQTGGGNELAHAVKWIALDYDHVVYTVLMD
jgi:hypothetical protein